VERLRKAGVRMSAPEDTSSPRSNLLEGKTIVISGTFSHHSRDEYKELIEANGGKNTGSISKKTDYVLAGENMGPAKLEKASKLGIEIINEEQFLKIINQL
jgi:DNA ligase